MTSQQQAEAVITVCGDVLDTNGQNFVKVLSDNKRLSLLPEISKQFEQHKAALEKNVEVEVSTAFELDAASIEALGNALKTKLERDVKVNTVVDKSLVGGVYIRAGDIVIDSSVRGRLAKLAEAMNA
jgi:F-type H+-transporting ATPase subunit delta